MFNKSGYPRFKKTKFNLFLKPISVILYYLTNLFSQQGAKTR